jgi:hypothetical protein
VNDFALEELKLILDDIDDLRFSKFYGPNNIALRKKVVLMIDSYCEHSALKDVGKEYKVCRGCSKEIYE